MSTGTSVPTTGLRRRATGPRVPVPADDATAVQVARALSRDLEAGASARDRERRLPHAEMADVTDAGLLALTVAPRHGGLGARARTVAEVFAALSEGDASIGQVPQNHYFFVDVLAHTGTEEQQAFFAAELLHGARLGNALSERGSRTALVYDIGFRREPGGDVVVDGTKFYATGSPFAHWVPIFATDADGLLQAAFVPADDPGVTVVDDWRGMGQRTTGSGTVRFEQVRVPADLVVPAHRILERTEVFGAFGNLMHAAVDVGIAAAALRDGRALLHGLARPWGEADVERAVDEPSVVERFGELALLVRGARALLREAGDAVDVARADLTERSSAEASAAVAAARAHADTAALTVASDVFALIGSRSAAEDLNLHRHWRDARTHTLHDPRRWKVRHLGAWELDDVAPPRNGVG